MGNVGRPRKTGVMRDARGKIPKEHYQGLERSEAPQIAFKRYSRGEKTTEFNAWLASLPTSEHDKYTHALERFATAKAAYTNALPDSVGCNPPSFERRSKSHRDNEPHNDAANDYPLIIKAIEATPHGAKSLQLLEKYQSVNADYPYGYSIPNGDKQPLKEGLEIIYKTLARLKALKKKERR